MSEQEKPFIAMNLSNHDWDILNGCYIDKEYRDDYLDPLEADRYVYNSTKPVWA